MTSSAPKTTTQTNKIELSPEQKQLFGLAFPFAEQYASQPLESYGGQTVAGANSNITGAQDAALGAVGGINGLAGQAAGTQGFLLNPALLSPDSNPYLKAQGDAITGTVTDNLLERVLPSLRSGATGASGMYSGGNTKSGIAEGLAVGKTNADISSALAGLYGDAYKLGLSTLGSAVERNPSVQAQQLMGATVQGAVGAQQQQQQQAELTDAYNRWMVDQQLPFVRAQDIMGMINGMPGASGTSTVTGQPGGANPFMGGLGGAASGAAMGSAIMPGIGTAIGAGLGGLAGFFGSR